MTTLYVIGAALVLMSAAQIALTVQRGVRATPTDPQQDPSDPPRPYRERIADLEVDVKALRRLHDDLDDRFKKYQSREYGSKGKARQEANRAETLAALDEADKANGTRRTRSRRRRPARRPST